MTAAASDTLAALLEAIRAEPEDDTVRLALADWLEENGDPARGEFIRVQVELALRFGKAEEAALEISKVIGERLSGVSWANKKSTDAELQHSIDFLELKGRESALLAEHEARWRRGGKCERCGGIQSIGRNKEYSCGTCHGTGWERWWLSELLPLVDLTPTTVAHGPQGRDFVHPVHFERGLITQVDANLHDIMDEYGKATPWALACVRGEPGLRRLWPVDRTPYDFDVDDGMRYGWHPADNYQVDEPDHIPRELFNAIFKRVKEWEEATYFDSPAAANRALATAAWQVVSEQA